MSDIPEQHRIGSETVDRHISHLQKLEQRSQQLVYGPGGIMEMKQTSAMLERYRDLVHFIANDWLELSYEKAQWQRDDWKKRCMKLRDELELE